MLIIFFVFMENVFFRSPKLVRYKFSKRILIVNRYLPSAKVANPPT